jgi:colicin import membrane protein
VTADRYITSRDQTVSGALALMMHLLFFALLVFGVTWQKREPAPVVAELWSNLPAPKAAPAPPPPKAEPEPPKPPPKAEAKPVPKVEPKPVPKVEPKPAPKPDIALREKKEKALKAKERELAEKKKREEQARLDALKQQQAKEAEAMRLAREQDEALRKLAQIQAAAQATLVDEYKHLIREKIKRSVIEPPNLPKTAQVEFDVVLLPGGDVLSVKLRKSSALALYDSAVERAILKAQPLPLPPDPTMFKHFRELNLIFRPEQ